MTTINTIEIPLKKRAFNKGLLSSGLVFSLSIWILQENYTGSGLPLSVFLLKNVLALTCFVLFGAAFLLFISKIISRKMAITVSDNGIVERLSIGYFRTDHLG